MKNMCYNCKQLNNCVMFAEGKTDCERTGLWRILLNQMPKGQGKVNLVNLSGKRTKGFNLFTFAESFLDSVFVFKKRNW